MPVPAKEQSEAQSHTFKKRNKFRKVRNKVYVDTYMIEYKSISNGRCKKIS
jgi:hypothetical protein